MSLTSTPPRLGKDLSLARDSSTGTGRDSLAGTGKESLGATKDLGRFGRAKKVNGEEGRVTGLADPLGGTQALVCGL